MILSHSHQFIFIKSRKTAGTSVEAALSTHCSGADVVTPLGDYSVNRAANGQWVHQSMNAGPFQQHDVAGTIRDRVDQKVWDTYFKFSITRNPWDRVVSLFTWRTRNNPAFKPQKRFYHHLGLPFDEFRENRKLFARFVRGDWDTNDEFYLIDGKLCVDFVIRYERLEEDLGTVCERLGLPRLSLPRLKSGMRTAQRPYQDYYDSTSKDIVAARHSNDCRLFGYEFLTS